MPEAQSNIPKSQKWQKVLKFSAFALLVADHNLMEGGCGISVSIYTTSRQPQKGKHMMSVAVGRIWTRRSGIW